MQYFTIQDHFKFNGDRHLERAIAYASAQWPEHYYQGSIKKALRNYKKVDEFSLNLPPEVELACQQFSDRIVYGLMFGDAILSGE